MARVVAQGLAERWNKSVVVDNRTGGGGVIAVDLLTHAVPDGYTLYAGGSQVVTATPLHKGSYDIRKTFDPVVQLTSSSYLFLVYPALPVNSVNEFLVYAKAKPDALSYGSSGTGSETHLGMELFKYMAGGFGAVHVPYRGSGQAIFDLMSGQTKMQFVNTISGAEYLKSGKLKALAVTSSHRLGAFPDLPTVSEAGVPGFELENMYGLYAPAGTGPAILLKLHREVAQIMNSPGMKSKLDADGAEAAPPSTPAAFKAVFIRKIDMWEKFIKSSGIKTN